MSTSENLVEGFKGQRVCAVCTTYYERLSVEAYCCSKECSDLLGKEFAEIEAYARANQDKKKWVAFVKALDTDRKKKK